MPDAIPSIFLVVVIVLTLILLPYLNYERSSSSDEPRRSTEELHIKPQSES